MSENIYLLDAAYSPYANIKSLGDAMEVAVRITDQMIMKNYFTNEEYSVNMPVPDKDNTYSIFAGTISFNHEGKKYELPYSSHIERVLEGAGFQEKSGRVVAAGGWYPSKESKYWEYLVSVKDVMEQMKVVQEIKQIKEELVEYCWAKGIKPLDEKYRDRCFKIPDNGYVVAQNSGTEKLERPRTFEGMDRMAHAKTVVGKISEHISGGGYSDAYTFVDVDGTTYVTKSMEVIKHLRSNGFTTSDKVKHMGLGWYEKFKDPIVQEKYTEFAIRDEDYEKKKKEEKEKRSTYVTDTLRETRDELSKIKSAKEAADVENQRLRAMLEQAGIDPDKIEQKPSLGSL